MQTTKKMRLLAVIALLLTSFAAAQQVPNYAPGFTLNGFIEDATCDSPCSTLAGGTLTLNHMPIKIPANTIVVPPGTEISWGDVFSLAPAIAKPFTGLALNDPAANRLPGTYQALVQGNIVNGTYIAGLVFIMQTPPADGAIQGFIQSINYTDGSFMVSNGTPTGVKVVLNDPIILDPNDVAVGSGRHSVGQARNTSSSNANVKYPYYDVRFTMDQDNPMSRAETGYPMCIPRTVPPAIDPRCPQRNRPKKADGTFLYNFTMDPPSPTGAVTGALGTDVFEQMPYEVGDSVAVEGIYEYDSTGSPIYLASSIVANVGAYTFAGSDPAYVALETLLQGTGAIPNPNFPQETTAKIVVVGFSTDETRTVDVMPLDIDCSSGAANERTPAWVTSLTVDAGPPTGAVRGRFRFRPLGGTFLPPARDVRVRITGANAAQAKSIAGRSVGNGLRFDLYDNPEFSFVFPENLAIGDPPVTFNFADFQYLAQGAGLYSAPGSGNAPVVAGQLTPWPDDPSVALPPACAPKPPMNANFTVNPNPVISGNSITFDASAAAASGATTFAWSPQISCSNFSCSVGTLIAPVGPSTFTETLSVNGGKATSSQVITVNAPSPSKDVVTLSTVVYRTSKARLDVNATSSIVQASPAACSVTNLLPGCMAAFTDITNPATGKPYSAVMHNLGNGTYTVTFFGLAAPNTVTVVSGNGGSATGGVTRVR